MVTSAAACTTPARQGPAISLELETEGISLGELANLIGERPLASAIPAAISISVRASGASPQQLAASAEGRLLVRAGALDVLGGDLLIEAARRLNPATSSPPDAELVCGVLRFDIRGGVASTERGIGIQSARANITGGGSIDLGEERIDIALQMNLRQGMGLSAAALASLVRVRGSLLEPGLELSGSGLAKAGATVGAAIVTGGLSLLAQTLFDRISANDDPCATALRGAGAMSSLPGDAPAKRAKPAGSTATQGPREESRR